MKPVNEIILTEREISARWRPETSCVRGNKLFYWVNGGVLTILGVQERRPEFDGIVYMWGCLFHSCLGHVVK